MGKHRKRPARSVKVTSRPAKAGNLKEQLKHLSSDQFVEIVEKFLGQLDKKQRLEFLNLLPSVKSQDLEVHLPYDSDEGFLAEIEDFCERVRSEEFVEYGAGYDPEEGAHHGFGDDSRIGEMDELFEMVELFTFAEIMRRVNRMRRIETRSPEGTIRNAIGHEPGFSEKLNKMRRIHRTDSESQRTPSQLFIACD
jgi:hypothetical protein